MPKLKGLKKISKIERKDGESYNDYFVRLFDNRDVYNLKYNEIAELLNHQNGNTYGESAYRKEFAAFNRGRIYERNKNPDKRMKDIYERELSLQKELVKLRDYRSLINKEIRDNARIEYLRDIISDYAKTIGDFYPVVDCNKIITPNMDSPTSAIVCLSDWHIGLEIDNYLNKYNIDIFKQRINNLVCQIISKLQFFKVENLYVVNLSDLISGIIHSLIRLQNRENLIQQIMIASETLAEILIGLSRYVNIEYYSTIDNHSRIIADKHNSLDAESFVLIIDWFLKERFKDIKSIHINENDLDNELCTFQIYDWNYLGCHGHRDSISNVVQNQTLMTKQFYNVVLTAHYHHSASDEIHGVYVYSNGCISGADSHSKNLRRTSNPSQTMIIVTPEDCASDICVLKV